MKKSGKRAFSRYVHIALVLGSLSLLLISILAPRFITNCLLVYYPELNALLAIALIFGTGAMLFSPYKEWREGFKSRTSATLFSSAAMFIFIGHGIPLASTYQYGQPFVKQYSVSEKTERFVDKTSCKFGYRSLKVTEFQGYYANLICVPKVLWENISVGGKVLVEGVISPLAIRVDLVKTLQ